MLLEVGLILVCILCGGFFAGMETGVISVNRLRLRHMVRHRVPNARVLQQFVANPEYLLGTTLIGTNICYVSASVLAADLGARLGGAVGTSIAALATSLIILIFAEYSPKTWFQSNPTLRVLPLAGLLKAAAVLLRPLSWSLGGVLTLLIPLADKSRYKGQPLVSREELLHLAREGVETGVLTRDELRMIRGVFQLRGKTCGDIMVPCEKIVSALTTATTVDLIELARKNDANRFPVWDKEKKAFVGVVHIYDVLADPERESKKASDYMRPVQLVSSGTPADHVLPRMRLTRQPLVLVTDERYEVVGLVTLSDVMEEVVGAF